MSISRTDVPAPVAPNAGPDASSALEARIQELQREMQAREQAAYQRGRAEAASAAVAESASRFDGLLAKLASSVAEIASLRSRVRLEAEEDVVQLAIAIARRVLRREIATDPEALLGIVIAAVERLDSREVHRVRTHPEDAPAIEKHLRSIGAPPRIEVSADPGLERGSVIFETSRGSLDASVSTQIAEIERGLADLARTRHT